MSFSVWNNLDEIALFLGLERIDSETNEQFYNRIKAFGRWKYKTDYFTQVHSIPIQTGLQTNSLVRIICADKYECKVDWEYFTLFSDKEAIRVFINTPDSTLGKILDAIDKSTTFDYKLYDESTRTLNCKFLVRNTNVKQYYDYIGKVQDKLEFKDIVKGTLKSEDPLMFLNEKENLQDLKSHGDFFVDYKNGWVSLMYPGFDGGYLTYKYYDNAFYIESTEMNLIPVNNIAKYGLTDQLAYLLPHIYSTKVWG